MSEIDEIFGLINSSIDECIAVSPKLYTRFVDRYNTNDNQTFPKEDGSETQLSIDDDIDVQIYHRILTEDIEENEEESYGMDKGEEIVKNVVTVVILSARLSRDTIDLIKGAFPRRINHPSYQYINLSTVEVDWQEDEIIEEEFGGIPYEKFKFSFNTYALGYTITSKRCNNCGESVIVAERAQFIANLQALDEWSSFDSVKVYAGSGIDYDSLLLDQKGSSNSTKVEAEGDLTFVKNKGYKSSNGAYLNTNYIQANGNASLTSFFALEWLFDIPSSVSGLVSGVFQTSTQNATTLQPSATSLISSINTNVATALSYTPPSEAVWYRTLEGGRHKIYADGIELIDVAATPTALELATIPIFQLGGNGDGSLVSPFEGGIGISIYGSGLSTAGMINVYNTVNTFLTRIGVR